MMADDGSQLTGEAKGFSAHRRLDLANEHDFQLGAFRVRPAYREVRRGDLIDILEPRVMQVLAALARRMGAVVSRDELLRDCWGEVSVTDDSLHRCIGRLRKLAETDGGRSFVIETVPRVGYRLVASDPADLHPAVAPDAAATRPAAALPPRRRELVLFAGLAALAALLAVGAWLLSRPEAWRVAGYESAVDTRSSETGPALSAAGRQLAYASGPVGARDIYVRNMADGSTALLVGGPGDDMAPAWSPSGDRLAFVRRHAGRPCEILIRTLPNGPERRIASCEGETSRLAWAPDGARLYFLDAARDGRARRIHSVAAEGGPVVPVTHPPAWMRGDAELAISPDSRRIAFVRWSAIGVSDIYVQDLAGGEARRVTFDGAEIVGLAWAPSGRTLFFSSNRGGDFGLWSVPAKGGEVARLGSGTRELRRLSSAPDGVLAVELIDLRANLAEAGLGGRIITDQAGVQWAGDVSPTGALAFVSDNRSGRAVWIRAPGQPDQKVTSLKATHLDDVRWSPDGGRLVFGAAVGGRYGLYEIAASGGPPRLLFGGPFEIGSPSWEADGWSLVFSAKQGGVRRLWRMDTRDPGSARPITGPGWIAVRATPAGLLAVKEDAPGIWRIEPDGRETLIVGAPAKPDIAWLIRGGRQYWIEAAGGDDARIMSAGLDGSGLRMEAEAPQATTYSGLTFEPATGALIYTREVRLDSDIGVMRLARGR